MNINNGIDTNNKTNTRNGIYIAILMTGFIFAGFILFFLNKDLQSVKQKIDMMPQIVVVDIAEMLSSISLNESEVDIEKQMLKTKTAISKLKDAGFLVVDKSAVLGAPQDLFLTNEDLN